jgi:anti-sigma factor RsiW
LRGKPSPEPVEELLEEPLVAITPGGEEVELTEIAPAVEPEAEPEAPAPALPRTATPFPIAALVGLLGAGVASMLRFSHK